MRGATIHGNPFHARMGPLDPWMAGYTDGIQHKAIISMLDAPLHCSDGSSKFSMTTTRADSMTIAHEAPPILSPPE